MTGKYFVIEGPDMAGKSTQIDSLSHHLSLDGYVVYRTREPGGTSIGEKIRDILKDPELQSNMTPKTNLYLFNGARAQTFAEIIMPILQNLNGDIILSDRSFFSTIAYQGFGQGMDLDEVKLSCEYAMYGIMPTQVFFLEISYEEAMRRKQSDGEREGKADAFDDREEAFHKRVRRGYEWAAQQYDRVVTRINGEREPEIVAKDILAHVKHHLK
jgi:dTMP kinase